MFFLWSNFFQNQEEQLKITCLICLNRAIIISEYNCKGKVNADLLNLVSLFVLFPSSISSVKGKTDKKTFEEYVWKKEERKLWSIWEASHSL